MTPQSGRRCRHKSVDSVAARRLGDEFMADLIAHRTDATFDKMEPEFTKTVNRSDFRAAVRQALLLVPTSAVSPFTRTERLLRRFSWFRFADHPITIGDVDRTAP